MTLLTSKHFRVARQVESEILEAPAGAHVDMDISLATRPILLMQDCSLWAAHIFFSDQVVVPRNTVLCMIAISVPHWLSGFHLDTGCQRTPAAPSPLRRSPCRRAAPRCTGAAAPARRRRTSRCMPSTRSTRPRTRPLNEKRERTV